MSADTDIMTLRYNILQEVRRKKLSKDDERRLRAEQGVYGISVAADLVGVGQQTLRLYERKGLVEPERTEGGTRRYSENDVERMRRIGELVDDGLNLAGFDKVLRLEEINAALQRELDVAKERDRGQKRPANQR
jgi:MerR family transcriptional regulator/heat shock protein HspR